MSRVSLPRGGVCRVLPGPRRPLAGRTRNLSHARDARARFYSRRAGIIVSIGDVVEALVDAGASPSMILAAVRAAEKTQANKLAQRRASDAARQASKRLRDGNSHVTSRDVTTAVSSHASAPAGLEVSLPEVKESKKQAKTANGHSPDDFERFWKAYPRREGSNPKHTASLRFMAAVKAGTEPDAIIGAASRYSAAEGALGHIGTPYVMQATTWLNQHCWGDYPAEIAVVPKAAGPPPGGLSREEVLARYQRIAEQQKVLDDAATKNPDGRVLRDGGGLRGIVGGRG